MRKHKPEVLAFTRSRSCDPRPPSIWNLSAWHFLWVLSPREGLDTWSWRETQAKLGAMNADFMKDQRGRRQVIVWTKGRRSSWGSTWRFSACLMQVVTSALSSGCPSSGAMGHQQEESLESAGRARSHTHPLLSYLPWVHVAESSPSIILSNRMISSLEKNQNQKPFYKIET